MIRGSPEERCPLIHADQRIPEEGCPLIRGSPEEGCPLIRGSPEERCPLIHADQRVPGERCPLIRGSLKRGITVLLYQGTTKFIITLEICCRQSWNVSRVSTQCKASSVSLRE